MKDMLSAPLELTDDFDESMDIAFSYFNEKINNRDNRPTLFGKNIFIEAHEVISNRPAGFWHVVSLEESHTFNKVLPCSNDGNIALCSQNCNLKHHQISLKYGTETRNLCLLRASRIPWIVDIINLANEKVSTIKTWLKPGNGMQSGKLFLRYQHGRADYVIIFSVEKRFYRLISAFPVFYLNEKADFDEDFSDYAWSYGGE